jgi:Zn-dependent peptidase ImmA (M78 family)
VIFGNRVRQARELLGETQTDFGEEIGVAQAAVSRMEKTIGEAPDAVLSSIASHTGFPAEFFSRPPGPEIEEYQFRSRLRFKAADRHRAVRAAEVVHESYSLMRQHASGVPVRLPDLSGRNPAAAAREMRSVLAVHPHAPLGNLMLPIERTGVVVLALPVAALKHDAFCWWHSGERGSYPVISVLAGAPGDRLRWNVAHELGHLILHRAGGTSREIEAEADEFAAELLTPLSALRSEMPSRPKLSNLYAMKARWGVSVQSLIRRARELGAVDDHQYMSLFRQISARGERMNERYQVKREKPRGYRKMAEVLYGDSPVEGVATLSTWTPSFAADVLEGFAGRRDLPPKRAALPPRGDLATVVPIRGGARR